VIAFDNLGRELSWGSGPSPEAARQLFEEFCVWWLRGHPDGDKVELYVAGTLVETATRASIS
jgi:hypothetical protein